MLIVDNTAQNCYIMFKNVFKTEPYVMMYMSRLQRSLMAQLPLKIETGGFQNVKDTNTGQYRKLKVSERVCDVCKNDHVENEILFVCNCESYM